MMTNCFSGRGLACAALLTISLFATHATAADEPAAKPFLLRAIDPGTKQPIPNVNVKFNIDNGKMVRTATDAEGKLTFVIPVNAKYVYINLTDPARVPLAMQFRPAQEAGEDHYDAMMPVAVPINGRVQDEAGDPVAGATVVLSVRTNRTSAEWPHVRSGLSWEQVKTDADGHWEYNQAPEDLSTLQVAAWHPQYLAGNSNDGYYSIEKVDNPASLRDGSFVKTLRKGMQVSGRVIDADGKPVAKASVGVGQDRVPSNVMPLIKVDAEGKFVVGAVAGQPITITATAKGYAPELQTFTVKDPPDEIVFKLGPPKTLTGVVTDTNGKPLPGANVYIDSWRGARTINKMLNTDGSGRFTWKEAPADAVQADVMDRTHAAQRNVTMTAGTEAIVKLIAPMSISGTVIDDESGQPIPSFDVITGIRFQNETGPMRWQRYMNERGEGHATGGKFMREFNETYPGIAVRIEAPGYLPAESPVYTPTDGAKTVEIRMKHGSDISAMLTDAAGKPLTGAEVALVLPGNPFQMLNGRMPEYMQDVTRKTTNAEGKFSFAPQAGAFRVIAMADGGYIDLYETDLARAGQTFAVKPWGRLEGVARIGSKPAADAQIDAMNARGYSEEERAKPLVYFRYEVKADAEGKFAFDRVVPEKVSVSRRVQLSANSYSSADGENVMVTAGETAKIIIGGQGRPVVGKIVLPPEMEKEPHAFGYANLFTKIDEQIPYPPNYKQMSVVERLKWNLNFRESDAGKAWIKKQQSSETARRAYNVAVNEDGTFRIDDVRPGTYTLNAQIQKPAGGRFRGNEEYLGHAMAEVVVPPIAGGQTDEPLTVSPITAIARQHTEVGQPAVDFSVMTPDEKSLSLKDLRGKLVLLHFGGLTEPEAAATISRLKTLQSNYGTDGKFTVFSIAGEMLPEKVKTFADKNGVTWPLGIFEYEENSPIGAYDMNEYPAFWLIDASGKVIGKNLKPDALEPAIKAAIAK